MAAAGFIIEGVFALFGAIPTSRPHEVATTQFEWNYTTFLNILFLGVFVVLLLLARNRERLGGGKGYAIDPVCGMQVEKVNAPAHLNLDGVDSWFCSEHCAQKASETLSKPAKVIDTSGVGVADSS
jgi:YHS domain-containing protein